MVERAGVLAMQGDVAEHVAALERACGPDVTAVAVRSQEAIHRCDLIALPGGESTTISRLIGEHGLGSALREHVSARKPLLATCAGLIIVAREVPDDRIDTLDLLDVRVDRNAFGRQKASFEAPLDVTGLNEPFPGVFIRAPRITGIGDVEVLARYDGEPVAVRQGPVVGASFHPELTSDARFHRLALSSLLAQE